MNRRQLRTRMFSLLLLAVLGVCGGNPAYIEFHKGEESATSRDWNNAITHYTEALRLKPSYAEAYFKRGNAYLHMEKYNRALKDYDEAIRLSPDTATAYRNDAIMLTFTISQNTVLHIGASRVWLNCTENTTSKSCVGTTQ